MRHMEVLMKISFITDEVTQSFDEAVLPCEPYGLVKALRHLVGDE